MSNIYQVRVGECDFENYRFLTPRIWRRAKDLAKFLAGKKIIHINSTDKGGGVAEMLHSQIPLERSLGLDSQWFVIKAPLRFFEVTKKMHNLLQGEKGELSAQEKEDYLKWANSSLAADFRKIMEESDPDIVVIHDPQPLPLAKFLPDRVDAVFRLHMDLSTPNPSAGEFLSELAGKFKFKKIIVTSPKYFKFWDQQKIEVMMPAIDPLCRKNELMSVREAKKILKRFGIDPRRPLFAQVSRFDKWKDPLGVIETYRAAKERAPGLQLILAGFLQAKDDPEAEFFVDQVLRAAKGDPDIHVFHDQKELDGFDQSVFINAVFRASDVVAQKSLREGFGLTVTEAMWKGKPVIGGQTTGIALQIEDGKNGFLVDNVKQASDVLVELLQKPKLRTRIGRAAHAVVRRKFLISRLVLEHLQLYRELTESDLEEREWQDQSLAPVSSDLEFKELR